MPEVVREIERKYDVTGAGTVQLESVAGVASVSREAEEFLDAVYYDTEDLRLIRGGVTLRQRSGGSDAGWQLKLPAAADVREEIRLPLGKPDGQVPEELSALVRARTRGAALLPIVRIRTARVRRQLLDQAGQPLAEVAVDKVSAEPVGRSGSTSWEEMEVELVTGARQVLTEVEARLLAAGARPAATQSKLARALADRLPVTAAQRAPYRSVLTPASAAADVVLAYLDTQVHAVIHLDPLVRRNEPDALHQMRVATRRARSALQVFGAIIDRQSTRPLQDELRWLASVLGRARDAEVLLARLTDGLSAVPAELPSGPAGKRITRYFSRELARAHKTAVHELDGPRYLALLDSLDALIERPPLTPLAAQPAARALRRPVRKATRRLEAALARIREDGPGQDKNVVIHEARKAAKRARYAAEAAAPALGKRAASRAARAKALQALLGDHHDSVEARALLRRLAGQAHAVGEDTTVYGAMYEREARAARLIERSLTKRHATGGRGRP